MEAIKKTFSKKIYKFLYSFSAKYLKFAVFCSLVTGYWSLVTVVQAGDITVGAVPGSINYQGRIEKDNAPYTGILHLKFRFYDALTAGNLEWESPELVVNAVQGIFSAAITPPWSVFASQEVRYLEIQVESDVLSPRENMNSVVYSLIAKRLEDGSDLSVSTLTASYNVFLATAAGNVGIGTNAPNKRLVVNGGIRLLADGIYFADNSYMSAAGVGSAGAVSANINAVMVSDADDNGTGDIIFQSASTEKMRMINNGNMGIGTTNPLGKLDVNGSLYVSNSGIYDRDDGEINIKEDLIVEGGKITGMNSESVSIGETDDVIYFFSGGSERMRIHSNGNMGVGIAAPSQNLHVSGNAYATSGIRGGDVSIGSYSGAASNELRSQTGNLLIQQTGFNVGIATDTPKEKLHVGGTIRAEKGITASTAVFSGAVNIQGNFTANSGMGNSVYLSSTVIYGTLQVTGSVGSDQGYPAYLSANNTFSGQNVFSNLTTFSNNALVSGRIGVGTVDFNFPSARYLQVGDDVPAYANDDALAYLVSGANANPKLYFYRSSNEIARLETQGTGADKKFGIVMDNKTKLLIDSNYYGIYNTAVWISTDVGTTPGIYVSPTMGNVGMGTTILDPNWKLTVEGNIRISTTSSPGKSYGLIFADGTLMTSAGVGSTNMVSNNGDALVQSDLDSNGAGDVILRAGSLDGIIVKSGGSIGIGTPSPVSKLNVRGGDLVLGNPYNPYASNGVEDLIVAGSLIIDGGVVQRSASPVELSALTVSGNVYLSTSPAARTGIGNNSPSFRLDVTDDINAGGSIRTAGTVRISNTGVIGSGGGQATWDGLVINVDRGGTGAATFTAGGILYGNGTGAIQAFGVMTDGQLLIGDGSGAPTLATLTPTANQVNVTNGPGTITLSLPQDINTTNSPTFVGATLTGLTGMLKGNAAASVSNITGTQNRVTRWADNNTIGASSILTDNGVRFTVSAPVDLTGSITTTSSGTFLDSGASQYSIETSSGILINAGRLRLNSGFIDVNSGKIVNLVDPTNNQDAATKAYVDGQIGGANTWNRGGNTIIPTNYMGSNNDQNVLFKRNSTEIMRLESTGITVTGNITVSGTVDGVDVSDHAAATNAHSATNLNTASRIVMRDASGDFSAGTITAVAYAGGNVSSWDTAYSERRQWDGGSTNLVAATGRTSLGLGSLATLNAVSGGAGGTISDGTIVDADINASAGIVDTKLATISTAGKVNASALTGTIPQTVIVFSNADCNSLTPAALGQFCYNIGDNRLSVSTSTAVGGYASLAIGSW